MLKLIKILILSSIVSCSAQTDINQKQEITFQQLDMHLYKLVGAIGMLTPYDIYLGKDSIVRNKRDFYKSIEFFKKNSFSKNGLTKVEVSLLEATKFYVEFIENELSDYVKNLNKNFTEKEFLAYTKKLWDKDNNAVDRMSIFDKNYLEAKKLIKNPNKTIQVVDKDLD